MRTSRYSVSSARRLSSWLTAGLGLAAYVGLVYALILVPIQLEVPLPEWSSAIILPVTYGLLAWLWVGRPSIVRWLVATAVLSVLHLVLGMSREPLTALLDPALSGRSLPWILPPPLPELIGVMFLLVPLRDVLRAPVRLARERGAGAGRPSSSHRARPAASPRVRPAGGADGSLSESVFARTEAAPDLMVTARTGSAPAPTPPAAPTGSEGSPGHRAGPGWHREAEPALPNRRSDVVLRIALDRIMGQLPPGTFLAPEDEVAASLGEPGYLKIPGDLVVTQLAEGAARVAWADIVDQFPRRLIGLTSAEISEHLGDGLRLPLDEVISQLPHDLFVADTPAPSTTGFERIPVPFHPMEESEPAPDRVRERASDPVMTPAAEVGPPPVLEREPAGEVPRPVAPAAEPAPPVSAMPDRAPEPAPIEGGPGESDLEGPTVRVSFDRVAPEIPAEAFRAPVAQVSEHLQHPGALLVPQSVVLPQLAEGIIRVSWNVVAPQFPRHDMALSDAEVAERVPEGIRLPLDEVIRQLPADLFLGGGAAVDVRGLENFPAPFQPLLSDPAPEAPAAAPVAEPAEALPTAAPELPAAAPVDLEDLRETILPMTEAAPVVDESTTPGIGTMPVAEPMVERAPEPEAVTEGASEIDEVIPPGPPPADPPVTVIAEAEPIVTVPTRAPIPAPEPAPVAAPPWQEPAPIGAMPTWSEPVPPPAPVVAPSGAGPAEIAEARRIVALLAPIASFDASVQTVEGVTVFALASPTVASEVAITTAGLALPLLMDRRLPGPVEQITLRGPETALVLTPLGGLHESGPVLAAAAARSGGLALLEILCRRAAAERGERSASPAPDPMPTGTRGLASAAVPGRAAALPAALTAFGDVTASVRRDAESEAVFYFFLPAGADVPAVGAFAQDLEAVMRKAAGSGAVFRTAILRSRDMFLVIQPEEIGHGRSIVIVAGGPVTRPGLAYRQVERAAATLMSA